MPPLSMLTTLAIPFIVSGFPSTFGDFTNIDIHTGSEAFRIASYAIMDLRYVCNNNNSIACSHMLDCTLYKVLSAKKQLVNGYNVELSSNTSVGTLNMSVHYSTETINISSHIMKFDLPDLTIKVDTFEKSAPPCTPKSIGCNNFVIMPVCANGFNYMNPCFAGIHCRIDYKNGKCPSH